MVVKGVLASVVVALTLSGCTAGTSNNHGESTNNGGSTFQGTVVGRIVEFPDGSKVRCAVSVNGGISCDWSHDR